jgi:hypothetical protein
MSAPSVAKPSGNPDFLEPKTTVKGSPTAVPSSGDNNFEAGGGKKTVQSGGGDASTKTDAYKTEKKAQSGDGNSYF